jgi:biotin transport system substrate-specific component
MKYLLQPAPLSILPLRYHKLLHSCVLPSLLASCFIALVAQIKIPFYPIPMTLQSFAIALIALISPCRVAISAVVLYLSYVAVGLPVCASGIGGVAAFAGPTVGFLWGFIPMSGAIAWLMERYQPKAILVRVLFSFLGGSLLFLLGLMHLSYLFGLKLAIQVGLTPFIVVESAKYMLAAYLSTWLGHTYTPFKAHL